MPVLLHAATTTAIAIAARGEANQRAANLIGLRLGGGCLLTDPSAKM
eukprot:CAMPEP_0201993984 /NCGR_PEP_ID=MMETSP0905-20130828/1974_1 /ASSEMBLY_ACC=CAM_ASM_000554 /TAXON_ID=420261 /ORGANISM="Thalassiosira antarctica, Strain CCMP982" /LENGTH=46 /DNA_ID= /DNA_START= /DNA_END= /DNA_ORIENTATION=